jgi:[acyl-carrier-protein] S-malonyltransferase
LMEVVSGGKMAALIGGNRGAIMEAIGAIPDVVLANDNSEAQIVVSGTPAGVDRLLGQIKVKRAILLNVSGAFHSPFMANAAQQFELVLSPIEFQDAEAGVLSNVDPTPVTSGAELKNRLRQQMTGSVRWREICTNLTDLGATNAIEIGPGKVLAGLIKRTCTNMEIKNISTANEIG